MHGKIKLVMSYVYACMVVGAPPIISYIHAGRPAENLESFSDAFQLSNHALS